MATIVRGAIDEFVLTLQAALELYENERPGAEATLYRQNPAAVRIRVIDRRFEMLKKAQRHDDVWDFLEQHVPQDTLAEVSQVITLAPSELSRSISNLEFNDPTPSKTWAD